MVRVRTIPKAVAEIKKSDPESAINANVIRGWVKVGFLKPVNGANYAHTLINMDDLERLIAGCDS